MKKLYLIKGMFLFFLAFHFISCEDEPLTGEFPQDEQNDVDEGQFIAQIDGQEFIAASTVATLATDYQLVITGEKPGGKKISLKVMDAAVSNFDLSTGGSNKNEGKYLDGSTNSRAYLSDATSGGSGQLRITELDTVENTLTGTFNFIGIRVKVDTDGNPILDGNGQPVTEEIEITKGAFNNISFLYRESANHKL